MSESFFARIRKWAENKEQNHLTRKFGGTQRCPWCKQCAQRQDGWGFTDCPEDPFLDVLKCGVCGGTSLWHFAMGMIYVRPGSPPLPLLSSAFKGMGNLTPPPSDKDKP